jgi:RNA polymerase sigma factor (sigma-70 family)
MQQSSAISDGELLESYLGGASEPAFAELVRRHVGLVYSTALRITGDGQMARDVSQEVFLKLARQAGSLRNGGALSAWLYRLAHAQALNAVRAEVRRKRREQEAIEMRAVEENSEPGWESLRPFIDEAMGSLDRKCKACLGGWMTPTGRSTWSG